MNHGNAFRERLESDRPVLGARSRTFSPTVIENFGALGLDFVWLDFEHAGPSPYDSHVFENLTRAAELGGIELLVRIPEGHPPLIRKVLDAGVRNLLVPRVDSAEEVRAAVEATRFGYDGRPGDRGMASGRSSRWGTVDNYAEREDQAVCLGVMIEKTSAVEDLERILAVPELGFVFIGPSDLAVQLGHPGEKTHPEVGETIERIRDATLSAGVSLGGISHDPAGAVEKLDQGFDIVRIGGDLESAKKTLGDRLDRITAAL